MALTRSPQFMDDLIMSNALSKRGTVNDATPIAAAHAAEQGRVLRRAEDVGQRLGLAKQQLAEDKRQFDLGLGFKKDQLDYAKNQGNIASIISGVGLGVSGLGSLAERSRAQQRIDFKNSLIDKYSQVGDSQSMFYAELLKYLE